MIKASISAIEISDFNSIVSISDKCFGTKYLTIAQLNKMLENFGFYIKLEVNNEIIGFCLAQLIKPDEINIDFIVGDAKSQTIAVIKTLAIHPNFQRKGNGTKLLKHVVRQIDTLTDTSSIYYPSWIEPKSEGFCKSVKNEGFTEFQLYKNFWLNDSLQNKYTCIICGNPPCNCSMRLYRKG